jgi:UDP-N-acetylmuramoylalanine--D-glutamate ligase
MRLAEGAAPLAALAGRTVAVWGLGREGRAALEALADVPVAGVVAVDDKDAEYTTHAGVHVTALTGDAGRAALLAADVVLKSPGISRYEPRALEIPAAGHELTSGTARSGSPAARARARPRR